MHDLGALVWVVIVLIGVISSINKNAKKARAASKNLRRSAPQIPAAARAFMPPPPPPQVHLPKPSTPMGHVMPPVVAPAPLPAAPPHADFPHPQAAHVGTPVIRGMFQGPATLIRAIVAAEVLGPPKSLQEPSIWNPPHNEPSI